MTPATLLRLYPRAWRKRYGAEFLDACGDRLSLQQTIDIVCGAIDARFVPQSHLAAVRRAGGVPMSVVQAICARPRQSFGIVDGLKGAGAMLLSTAALTAASRACAGWTEAVAFFQSLSLPVATLVSAHVMFMKGQPAIAKAVIFGGTMTLLVAISLLRH